MFNRVTGWERAGNFGIQLCPHLSWRHIKDMRIERKKGARLHLVWLLAPRKSTSQFECDIKRRKKSMGMMIRRLMFLRNVDRDGLLGVLPDGNMSGWGCTLGMPIPIHSLVMNGGTQLSWLLVSWGLSKDTCWSHTGTQSWVEQLNG